MRTTFVALLAVLVFAGCERKQKCWTVFKGQRWFVVDGSDGWAYPGEICGGIARAVAESSEGARVELFGTGASEATTPLKCRCE